MGAERVEFTGALGATLAARYDAPDGPVRATALFAHCFACSKDTLAASRISQALSALGVAVLRFDFTGLGQSEGEFENTNFSSNVDDLVAAADWLRTHRQAPTLLIGHSLGGAAAIVAAGRIAEVKAVATIGAPAAAEHVTHQFKAHLEAIEREGEAIVQLGGRPFRVRREFLTDIRDHQVQQSAAALKRALLILHSPVDAQVGIENATQLFVAAKHPKSFVSLDHADHLLTRRDDEVYAAGVIAAWAARYVDLAPGEAGVAFPPALSALEGAAVWETGRGPLENAVSIRSHHFLADEPAEMGGRDQGPSPYDLLSAALATCTSMTARLYAQRKGWGLGRVHVHVTHQKRASSETEPKRDLFIRNIRFEGDLDAEQRQKLLEIAAKCPVHKTLEVGAIVQTEMDKLSES